MSGRLYVHYQQRLIGQIQVAETGLMQFTYAPEWLAASNSFPISVSLPLDGSYSALTSHHFFANLLPEAETRQQICAALGISVGNDFELLTAIGGDCAGTLSVESVRSSEATAPVPGYKPVADEQLKRWVVGKRSVFSTITGQQQVRLSLAGAQDKLPVHVLGDQIMIPVDGAPSTHILKFPSPHFSHLPENESFVTLLAATVQIPVVSLHLRPVGTGRLAIIERYDRIRDNQGYRRLHQEDFCQALGINAANKYEKEGGPSLHRCSMIVRQHTAFPLLEIQKLLKWTLFNWMVGNADAHAKNLSLLYDADGTIGLAPFYDLVCTRNYRALARDLAMGIGGTFNPDFIGKPQLAALAVDFGVQHRLVLDVFDQLLAAIPGSLDAVVAEWSSRYGSSPILARLPLIIRRNVRQIKTQWRVTST